MIHISQRLREIAKESPSKVHMKFEERVHDARVRLFLGESEDSIRKEHGLVVIKTARDREVN